MGDRSRRQRQQDSDALQGGVDPMVSPESEKPRRAFRVMAWIVSLWVLALSVFGLMELVLMWLPEGTLTSMFGDDISDIVAHRSHFMAVGIVAWAVVLSAFVQLRKPARRVAPMLLLVSIALGGAIVFGLSGTLGEWVVEELLIVVVPIFALAWLHPRRDEFGRLPNFDRPMAVLAAVTAAPWLSYAIDNARRQFVNVAGDTHAEMEHWATAALMALLIVVASVLGASDHPGWRLPAGVAAGASVLFGLHSLVFAGLASALSTFWAVVAIVWGAAFIVAAIRRTAPSPTE